MPKVSLTVILAALAAACVAAAGTLPEPYHSIGLALAAVLATFGGHPAASPPEGAPK
jgi:hypothetical protein